MDEINLARLFELMRQEAAREAAEDPPAEVVERAQRLFQPPPPRGLARVLASLVFDSFASPALAGVRSVDPATRQRIFRAGDFDVEVRSAPAGDLVRLSGQVLGPCVGGSLALEGPRAYAARLDEACAFDLREVEAGRYRVELVLDESVIEIESVDV